MSDIGCVRWILGLLQLFIQLTLATTFSLCDDCIEAVSDLPSNMCFFLLCLKIAIFRRDLTSSSNNKTTGGGGGSSCKSKSTKISTDLAVAAFTSSMRSPSVSPSQTKGGCETKGTGSSHDAAGTERNTSVVMATPHREQKSSSGQPEKGGGGRSPNSMAVAALLVTELEEAVVQQQRLLVPRPRSSHAQSKASRLLEATFHRLPALTLSNSLLSQLGVAPKYHIPRWPPTTAVALGAGSGVGSSGGSGAAHQLHHDKTKILSTVLAAATAVGGEGVGSLGGNNQSILVRHHNSQVAQLKNTAAAAGVVPDSDATSTDGGGGFSSLRRQVMIGERSQAKKFSADPHLDDMDFDSTSTTGGRSLAGLRSRVSSLRNAGRLGGSLLPQNADSVQLPRALGTHTGSVGGGRGGGGVGLDPTTLISTDNGGVGGVHRHTTYSSSNMNGTSSSPQASSTTTASAGSASAKLKPHQKVLALDMDGTLLYACLSGDLERFHLDGETASFKEVIPTVNGAQLYYVWERPYLQEFLSVVVKWFNLVVFTASVQEYADPLINKVEGRRKRIKRRYYRHDCVASTTSYSTSSSSPLSTTSSTSPSSAPASVVMFKKDLRILGVPLEAALLVDDTPDILLAGGGVEGKAAATAPSPPSQLQKQSLLLIPSFMPKSVARPSSCVSSTEEEGEDTELLKLLPILEGLSMASDVRSVLSLVQPL